MRIAWKLPWILALGALSGIGLVFALGLFTDEEPGAGVGPEISLPGTGLTKLSFPFDDADAGFEAITGRWEIQQTEAGRALVQDATAEYPLALARAPSFGDVDLRVRFRLRSGEEDRCAGLVFRARDPENYYLVRANGLESNFRMYVVDGGKRRQMRSVRIKPPETGPWHELRLVAQGPRFQAWLDGRLLIEHRDERLKEGRVGLWTKADSVTEFDDFEILGRALPSGAATGR